MEKITFIDKDGKEVELETLDKAIEASIKAKELAEATSKDKELKDDITREI